MVMVVNNNALSHHCQYVSVFETFNTKAYAQVMNTLRENIQSEMDKREWNAYRLSDESGVPQSTIQRFLTGKHNELRGYNVKKIADGFKISEYQLRGLDIQTKIIQLQNDIEYIDSLELNEVDMNKIPESNITRPPVINEKEWKNLSPQTRAFFEITLNKSSSGQLTDDHVKVLQNMVDVLIKDC
jgi:transcriptional regulator with XRE-family HTH domain